MTFKLSTAALTLALLPMAAGASPYCDALLNASALSGSHAKLAPIHSSTDTGWIFTDQMLTTDYAMTDSAQALVRSIVQGFAARDIPLAILVAPPRPMVAGAAVVDATAGPGLYDAAAAGESFAQLIGQLRAAGAIAPDLATTALGAGDLRNAFYFQRDTHWTAIGAALSAQALAAEIAATRPDLGILAPAALALSATMEEEKGSLAAVVRDACGIDPAHEAFALVDFPPLGGDLLGDAGAPAVTLLGTSFSNRYKTDFYRVGDALAWALNEDVQNLSESGTGMIGIIEGYVLSGALDNAPKLVIWETPYTESFNSTSNLRQLLGALQTQGADKGTELARASGRSVSFQTAGSAPALVRIDTGTIDPMKVTVGLTFDDGRTTTIKLERRDRVPAELRSPIMAASVAGYSRPITAITVEADGGTPDVAILALNETGF